jgi:VCBS repeat protein
MNRCIACAPRAWGPRGPITLRFLLSLVTCISAFIALPGNAAGEPLFAAEFFPVDAGVSPQSVAEADVNRDGKVDLVVSNSAGVAVVLGRGDGTFEAKTQFGVGGGGSVAVGDLNGDGNLDLVTGNGWYQHTLSVLLGDGNGIFGSRADYETGDTPFRWQLAT